MPAGQPPHAGSGNIEKRNKIRREKARNYRHRGSHGIGMWKSFSFGSGNPSMPFLLSFQKNRVLAIKKQQKVWRYQEYCLL